MYKPEYETKSNLYTTDNPFFVCTIF